MGATRTARGDEPSTRHRARRDGEAGTVHAGCSRSELVDLLGGEDPVLVEVDADQLISLGEGCRDPLELHAYGTRIHTRAIGCPTGDRSGAHRSSPADPRVEWASGDDRPPSRPVERSTDRSRERGASSRLAGRQDVPSSGRAAPMTPTRSRGIAKNTERRHRAAVARAGETSHVAGGDWPPVARSGSRRASTIGVGESP